MNNTDQLLDVSNLCVSYRKDKGYSDAVRGVSFTLGRERLGIVGESGSGKSTIGRALLKLLPSARITADRLQFQDTDLVKASEREMLTPSSRSSDVPVVDPICRRTLTSRIVESLQTLADERGGNGARVTQFTRRSTLTLPCDQAARTDGSGQSQQRHVRVPGRQGDSSPPG